MARQKGLFKVTGTIGGVNFYVVKGVGYARAAGGGFNGKAIKTKASMQRVRENASEFGHCSSVKKHFKLALQPLFDPPKSSTLHRRLMSLFTQLKDLDGVSPRGERQVAHGVTTAKGKRLLQDFVFIPECKAIAFVLTHVLFDWPTQTLSLGPLDLKPLAFPKGATHLVLTLGILDFNFDTLEHTIHCSSPVLLEKGSSTESFSLQPNRAEAPSNTGLAVIGLQFCEVVDGVVYGFNSMPHYDCKIVSCL